MADQGQVRVLHSPARERYEAIVTNADGEEITVGYLDYVPEIDQVVITHTVISEAYSGHGYAAELVRAVLDDIRASGKRVVPVCSYVGHFISRHPEYADLAVSVPHG